MSNSDADRHHESVQAAARIQRYAVSHHMNVAELARATGLPAGHVRAIVSGLSASVPDRALKRASDTLSQS